MGVMYCSKHGHVGLNFACKHIIQNIETGRNDKCFVVKLRFYPGDNASEWSKDELRVEIPVCLQCFEDKRLSERMKIEEDSLDRVLAEYNPGHGCALCILEYRQRNGI